jgi:putative ABC transport system permease protein
MLINFIKATLRSLSRYRFFTILNILGLTTGLACCIVIYLFVENELSYDRFHEDKDVTYRAIRRSGINGIPYQIGITSYPIGEALRQDFEGHIESLVRAMPYQGLVQYKDMSILEDYLMLADSNFFTFFSYPLDAGDPKTVLAHPNSVVLSKAMAVKYFGDDDAIGKVLRLEEQYDVTVTGLLADLPGNTHLRFDMVAGMQLLANDPQSNDWWSNRLHTYVKIRTPQSFEVVNSGLTDFMTKYFGKDFERTGNRIDLGLEPLQDIYFNKDTRYDRSIAHGDRGYVIIFSSIGVLILLMAVINYINLASAQASYRAKEVGVRKTLGSSVRGIATQFLMESSVLSAVSMAVAILVAKFCIPWLNATMNLGIPDVFSNATLAVFALVILVAISLLAGSYPAFLLSSLRPLTIIKGAVKGGLQYVMLRKGLVIFQFCISVFMIIATLSIDHQLRYMSELDPGFNSSKVMVVRMNNETSHRNGEIMKQRILANAGFESASFLSGYPGGYFDATTVRVEGIEEGIRMRTLFTDEHFAATMKVGVAAGRYFSEEFPADSTRSVLVNETAVRMMGWSPDEAIGKTVRLTMGDSIPKTIVGVIEDFHFISMKQQIEPMIVHYSDMSWNMVLRVSGDDLQQQLAKVESIWKEYSPNFPSEIFFLDERLSQLHSDDRQQGKMFRMLSGISIFIACVGILGLVAYIASERKKEMGIRKVIGATVMQIAFLLMKDLLALVIVAAILAIPLSYVAVFEWSEQFAYKAPFQVLIFFAGGIAVVAIATLVVGAHSLRTAIENPVKFLRSE